MAPVQFANGDEVLEIGVAAGTSQLLQHNRQPRTTNLGAWLYDAAREIDSRAKVKYHAIDIEARLFPPNPPANMTFSVASVLELPETWTGKFSYVHQRLLMAALTESQWPVAIQEIYRVLKPGGWVELGEGEAYMGHPDGRGRHRVLDAVHQIYLSKGLVANIGSELPNMLKKAGFVDIVHVPRKIPLGKWGGELGEDGLQSMGGFFRAIKKPLLLKGGLGIVKTGEEYDALVDDLEREWNEVPGYSWAHYITYARKPDNTRN